MRIVVDKTIQTEKQAKELIRNYLINNNSNISDLKNRRNESWNRPLTHKKNVKINPKFTPSTTPKKNYEEILKKGWGFEKFDLSRFSDYPFNIPPSYNPLGNGHQ